VTRLRTRVSALPLAAGFALLLTAANPGWTQPPEQPPQDPMFFVWLAVIIIPAVLLALVCGVAFIAVVTATKPALAEREAELLEHHRTAAFLWGLPTAALLFFLMAGLMDGGDNAKPLGLLVGGLLLAFILVGGAGLSLKVGNQLLNSSGGSAPSPVRAAAFGAAALFLLTFIPLVGWAYGVYNILLSVGAFRLAVFSRRRRPTTPPSPVPPTDEQPVGAEQPPVADQQPKSTPE